MVKDNSYDSSVQKEIGNIGFSIYKDFAKNTLTISQDNDKTAMNASKEYLLAVSDVYAPVRQIIESELAKEKSESRRNELINMYVSIPSKVMEESRKHDNEFIQTILQNQREYSKIILGSILIVVMSMSTGYIAPKYKKPLIDLGKQFCRIGQKI